MLERGMKVQNGHQLRWSLQAKDMEDVAEEEERQQVVSSARQGCPPPTQKHLTLCESVKMAVLTVSSFH